MATVVWSGNKAGQPAQGEMRRFILKARIDGRTTTPGGTALVYTDTNKAFIIKAGWFVKAVLPIIKVSGAVGYGEIQLKDSAGVTYGPTFNAFGLDATAGMPPLATTFIVSQFANPSGGHYYASDDYLNASFSSANFDGVLDIFADVIDTGAYENAGVSWSNNNL